MARGKATSKPNAAPPAPLNEVDPNTPGPRRSARTAVAGAAATATTDADAPGPAPAPPLAPPQVGILFIDLTTFTNTIPYSLQKKPRKQAVTEADEAEAEATIDADAEAGRSSLEQKRKLVRCLRCCTGARADVLNRLFRPEHARSRPRRRSRPGRRRWYVWTLIMFLIAYKDLYFDLETQTHYQCCSSSAKDPRTRSA